MEEEWSVPEAAAALREEADRRIRERLRALPQAGSEVRCRERCSACCRQLVVTSPMEALALRDYLQAHAELSSRLELRLATWEARVEADEPLAEGLARFEAAAGYLPDAEGGRLEMEYWQRQLACPFLENDLCSIYPVRPFACREHLVTSEPELCAVSPDAATSAGTRLEYRAVGSEVGAAAYGLEDRLVLLPRAPAFAEAMAEEAGRRAAAARVRELTADSLRRIRVALARLLFLRR